MKIKISDLNHHYIDDKGNVFNLKTNRVLKPYKGKNGYMMVDMWENNKPNKRYIHRLLGQAFLPNLENKRTINHIDGNKLNNDLSNLEWATDSENMQHAYNHNLNQQTKVNLTENNLKEIWKRFLNHETFTSMLKDYDIAATTMSNYIAQFVKQNNLEEEYKKEKLYQHKSRLEKRDLSHRYYAVFMCDKITHKKIKYFINFKEAITFLNKTTSGPISNVLSGKQKSAYGYYWLRA